MFTKDENQRGNLSGGAQSRTACAGIAGRFYRGIHPYRLFDLIAKLGVKNGYLLWPVRVAVSGKQFTPGGGIEICAILGKEESLNRIRKGIELLSK